jgi:taurine dioxygenase
MSVASAVASAFKGAQQTFDIRPLNGNVGAEIVGLDLRQPVND